MRLSSIKYYISLIIMLFSVACETDVDLVKAPEFIQKLVITAFVSPSDKISYFRVTSNKKLYGELNTEEPLGLLSGSISDGTKEVILDTCSYGLKLDHSKMKFQYGQTYKLKVSNEKGLKAEAECTIPAKKNFVMQVDTFSILTEESQHSPWPGVRRSLIITVKLSDLAGEDNFYRIFGTFRGYAPRNFMSGIIGFDKEFITDKGMDGKSIVVNSDQYAGYMLSAATDSAYLNIYLYNTEKSYFSYHKSLSDYVDGENPFTEASPVFSNITGGFGVFTSYTIDSLIVKLK
jgi:hypothetical protein